MIQNFAAGRRLSDLLRRGYKHVDAGITTQIIGFKRHQAPLPGMEFSNDIKSSDWRTYTIISAPDSAIIKDTLNQMILHTGTRFTGQTREARRRSKRKLINDDNAKVGVVSFYQPKLSFNPLICSVLPGGVE